MMTQLLEVTAGSKNLPIDEALGYGLPLSAFSLVVVFAVLALLWGILTLFKLFFYTIPNNKKKSGSCAPVNNNSTVQKFEMNGGAAAAVLEPSLADNEIIAAITAAIEAFRSQSGSVGGFRVVSFKKRK